MPVRSCLFTMLLLWTTLSPGLADPLIIGVANGFPPYQFRHQDAPAGFDVDMAKAVAAELNIEIRFHQDAWDNVVGLLRQTEIDCAVGMEVNPFRRLHFSFTTPYATRHDVVFVLTNSTVTGVEDLFGQIITGDRHSFVEQLWHEQGIYRKIRITQTSTKAEAMTRLADGRSAAAIMPLRVGQYLARENNLQVRVALHPDPGSEVGFAFHPSRDDLRALFDQALDTLRRNGTILKLEQKWFAGE